jgi:tetratricopeptide (TPR) repeat protein
LAIAADADSDGLMNRWRQARARNDKDAMRRLVADANLRGLTPPSLTRIANHLLSDGAVEDALRVLRAGQEAYPEDFWINLILARAWMRQKSPRTDEAIRYYTSALAVRPIAIAYVNLGAVLCDHARRYPEAEAAFRRAIELQPENATAHYNLGVALGHQHRPAEAEAAYRTAIELRPDFAIAYRSLGNNLRQQNRLAEAEAAFRKAVELKPDLADVHNNLGIILRGQWRLAEAEAAYRMTIEYRPNYAQAHCNFGGVLRQQGRFAESLASFRRGHELGSQRPDWNYPSAQWVQEAERIVAAEPRLEAVPRGDARPADDLERLALAEVCRVKRMYRTAASLASEAFAGTPNLAENVDLGYRYDAARAAVLAGCGQGVDVAGLDDTARAALRRQALDWLRANLVAQTRRLAGGAVDREQGRNALRNRQRDPDLAGVRDADALAKLPADERAAWERLWADVAAILSPAGGGK